MTEENSGIVAICNRYNNTFDNLIDSSDAESPDWPGPINKGLRNAPRFEGSSKELSEGDRLDKVVSDKLSRLAPKTRDSQVHHFHDVAPLGLKSERSRYGKGQMGERIKRARRVEKAVREVR